MKHAAIALLFVCTPLRAQSAAGRTTAGVDSRATASGVEQRADPEARPWFELAAQAGLNVPGSSGVLGWGPSAGGVVLLRPLAGLGVGLGLDAARFSWTEDAYVVATTTTLRLRLYLSIAAASDVYLEPSIGSAALHYSNGAQGCGSRGSGAIGFGVGAERYVTELLRAGAFIGYTESFVACAVPASAGASSPPSTSPGLAVRATATFGAG